MLVRRRPACGNSIAIKQPKRINIREIREIRVQKEEEFVKFEKLVFKKKKN